MGDELVNELACQHDAALDGPILQLGESAHFCSVSFKPHRLRRKRVKRLLCKRIPTAQAHLRYLDRALEYRNRRAHIVCERRIEAAAPFRRTPQLPLGIEQRSPHVFKRLRQAAKLLAPNPLNRKVQVLPGYAFRGARELAQRTGDMHPIEPTERDPAQPAVHQHRSKAGGNRQNPRHGAGGALGRRVICGVRDEVLAKGLPQVRAGHRLEQFNTLQAIRAAKLVISRQIVRGDRVVHLEDLLLRIPFVVIETPVVQLDLSVANHVDRRVYHAGRIRTLRCVIVSGLPIPRGDEHRKRTVARQVKLGGGEQLSRHGVIDIWPRINHAALRQAVFERHLKFVVAVVPGGKQLDEPQRQRRGDREVRAQIHHERQAERARAPPCAKALPSRKPLESLALTRPAFATRRPTGAALTPAHGQPGMPSARISRAPHLATHL